MTLRNQLLKNQFLEYQNNIFYQKDLQRSNSFEKWYLKLREKENRILSDDIVKNLPKIINGHPLKTEWDMRKATLKELIKHITSNNSTRYILEVGCGNGWLSSNLAASLEAEICALDLNETELLQGAKVFANRQNLCFMYADIFSKTLQSQYFDAVVLGSSVQYFQDLKKLISKLFELIDSSGKIYIVDSPFYSSTVESNAAKKRSVDHFKTLGVPEMAEQYFHHTLEELKDFNYKILYYPRSFTSLIKRNILHRSISVFPIICINPI